MAGPTTVDEYLATLPEDRRAVMGRMREVICSAAPDATEALAYKMPALRSHGGRFVVSYDAFKHHYSLFPASDVVVAALGAELAPYLSGKGTIRFPASRELPMDLIRRIVEIRVTENAAATRR